MREDLDDHLQDDLRDHRGWDSHINGYVGDLGSQMTDDDRLDVATQTRLMMEMLRKHQGQWKAEQRLERDRMVAEGDPIAAEWVGMGCQACQMHRMKRRSPKTQ